MDRIPFSIISVEADHLLIKMAGASSIELSYLYWDQYLSYLRNCGWEDQEFDSAVLKYVDANWDDYRYLN